MRQQRRFLIFHLAIFLIFGRPAYSQICANPSNIIYGLDVTGNIIPITVSTGVFGAKINAAYGGNLALDPNGIGYNSVNGRFYFFKRPPSDAPQEFVSYDPGLATTTILASCPTANIVYVGCVTADGTGYYCWDSQAQLFYYKISTNTWTLITTSLRDQFGKDVDSILRKHGSGDAAIDGSGNMIMLPSSTSRFAVYRMKKPLPTSAVASITVTEVLPPTNPPAKFVGIALNSTGQIFVNTANPDNRLFRLENNLTLTFISNLPGEIEDLTSCNYPFGVLAEEIKSFSVSSRGDAVVLNWQKAQNSQIVNYTVQSSTDGIHWISLGEIKEDDRGLTSVISFIDQHPVKGNNFYRILLEYADGGMKYTEVKSISVGQISSVVIWPNPVVNCLYIASPEQSSSNKTVTIFDQAGRKISQTELSAGANTVDMSRFSPGMYLLSIRSAGHPPCNLTVVKK